MQKAVPSFTSPCCARILKPRLMPGVGWIISLYAQATLDAVPTAVLELPSDADEDYIQKLYASLRQIRLPSGEALVQGFTMQGSRLLALDSSESGVGYARTIRRHLQASGYALTCFQWLPLFRPRLQSAWNS